MGSLNWALELAVETDPAKEESSGWVCRPHDWLWECVCRRQGQVLKEVEESEKCAYNLAGNRLK